jgi:hypothetical protein
MFKETKDNDNSNPRVANKDLRMVLDPTCVMAYIPKTVKGELAFSLFDAKPAKVPESFRKFKVVSAKLSKEYLKGVLKTLVEDDDDGAVIISLGQDTPVIFEDSKNAFVIAPRVDDRKTICFLKDKEEN